MAIHVALTHTTEYHYDRLVALSPHVIRLRPAPHCRTPIESYSLKVEPYPHFLNWMQDPFGNFQARLVFPERARELRVSVDIIADLTVINPFDFFLEESAERIPFVYEASLARELAPYLEVRESGPRLQAWVAQVPREPRPTVDFLVELNQRLQRDIAYTIRLEPGVQSCEETLAFARGSCRDSGWLLVQILRHLGLAARFVSGYLVQLAPDVKALDGPTGPHTDFTDLHAWAEVFVPGAGWVGLDPTSGVFAGEGHIPLACTPDPSAAAPISGSTELAEVEFRYSNKVTRFHEDPRVTRPYTEEQWAAIESLGHRIDEDLQLHDVRLTMGGEPTFVSIDDPDGAEWNTEALGPTKRLLAGDLLDRLEGHFSRSGIRHYGQGKWYPGEPLPRWSLACYWRRDGVPLWLDRALLGDERRQLGADAEVAKRFAEALARRLALPEEVLHPAFEDVYYYLWKEQNLPVDVDPLAKDLRDRSERERLFRLLERGLGSATGYAIPLRWENGWRSSVWDFRRGHLYLVPGDSPMGYRLPFDAVALAELRDDSARFERPTLIQYRGLPDPRKTRTHLPTQLAPTRTALCIEPRNGCLYVFLPPLMQVEHWIELLAALEDVAAETHLPILIEGYEPPVDPRLAHFRITPDPGVIEVNIHPATSWDELCEHTQILYEEARQTRLGTEKFMIDGRHSGTGGGNHVTLGGATPLDSPFLRRPDVLRSLVAYWQAHPSLSYLFSGMFIGPTSQSPRIDEARDDALYELEIAFQQMPAGEVPQPWLVDRLLRHLLVDITGNTHRAEFCIDKLHSPDSHAGRLGLVEFRAFEMPPHARMSCAQQLLLRALMAQFWKTPARAELVRWGTELHDRFLLPHYIWQDFREVICELRHEGYPFELEWFAPFFEFRFPHYGHVNLRGMDLELRAAIEPWHVLGEEVTGTGTARFVDSSVERLQVKVHGMTPGRFVVACNGRRVPLHDSGVAGEYVAGVRYRAWCPPSGLHPTIGVHSPLVFDLIDTWTEHSIGGCTYHVAHPGGRSFESRPINANAAEARRIARFAAIGHTPGRMPTPVEEKNIDFPFTLDLRYRNRCG